MKETRESELLTFVADRLIEVYGANKDLSYIKEMRELAKHLNKNPHAHVVNVVNNNNLNERYKMALEAIACIEKPYKTCAQLNNVQIIAKLALDGK